MILVRAYPARNQTSYTRIEKQTRSEIRNSSSALSGPLRSSKTRGRSSQNECSPAQRLAVPVVLILIRLLAYNSQICPGTRFLNARTRCLEECLGGETASHRNKDDVH